MDTSGRHATPPRVAVVTVGYDSDEVMPLFLASIDAASSEPVLVVVADNAPALGGLRGIAERAGAGYLALPSNPGYGGGMNAAVATLPDSVEWILVSNPDVVLAPGSIDALVAVGDDDDSIGAVGPRTESPSGEVYPSARRIPSLRTGVGHALFANIWIGNPWTRAYREEQGDPAVARDAGWLSGACVLVRRRAFEALGGFDEGYFMYFEDVDLGFRLGRAGWRNRYTPTARVVHTGAHSTGSRSALMLSAHHDSAKRFLGKKYAGPVLAPVRLALRVGLSLRLAAIRRRLRG